MYGYDEEAADLHDDLIDLRISSSRLMTHIACLQFVSPEIRVSVAHNKSQRPFIVFTTWLY